MFLINWIEMTKKKSHFEETLSTKISRFITARPLYFKYYNLNDTFANNSNIKFRSYFIIQTLEVKKQSRVKKIEDIL